MLRSFTEDSRNVRRQIRSQLTATQRLHDDNAHALLSRVLHSTQTRLIIFIKIVQLNLTKIPFSITINNFFERVKTVMNRETKETDFASFASSLQLIHNLPRNRLILPNPRIQRMQQIHIDMIRLQTLQLLIQNLIKMARVLSSPERILRRDIHLITITAFLQRQTCRDFTLTFVINVSSINIIQSVLNRVLQHTLNLTLIDFFISSRQPHHPKTKRRNTHAGFPKFPQGHIRNTNVSLSGQRCTSLVGGKAKTTQQKATGSRQSSRLDKITSIHEINPFLHEVI